MARINLLPWRAERRKQRQKEFTAMLGAAALWRAYRRSAVFVSVPETEQFLRDYMEAFHQFMARVLTVLPRDA